MSTRTDNPYLEQFKSRVQRLATARRIGYVREIIITTLKASLPSVTQGELCRIYTADGKYIMGEVIAFDENEATISCLDTVQGVSLGALVTPLGRPHCVKVNSSVFSKILDGMGRNLENPNNTAAAALSMEVDATRVLSAGPPASQRPPIDKPFHTGIRVIDGLLTLGKGQRVGIFAPPGCGKSTLMAQIVRGASVDAVVFGLVGERGRELREFIEREITADLRRKSIFVCATSDKSSIERVRCAFTATSIAEYLRDQGKSVLLLIDSLTRLARAQREIGLMAGEPTTQSGFTPSVYTILPELIERSGRSPKGDITAIYTVLMEGDRIEDDPVASEAKSLLDGHIVLSTKMVEKNHFPAIDPLRSLSRVMGAISTERGRQLAKLIKLVYSNYQDIELLLRLNEYQSGVDPFIDEVIHVKPKLDEWCQQDRFQPEPLDTAMVELEAILERLESLTTV